MKSNFLIILGILIFKIGESQNSSIFIGHWQYFDNKDVYHELVIEKSKGYIYGDSTDVAMFSVTVDSISILWKKLGKWSFVKKENEHIVVQLPKEQIKLYQLPYNRVNLKSFYLWSNNSERNGNGYMIFFDEMKKRQVNLKSKIKKGL